MRIIVTGGAGFIGSALVQKLRALGHDVWCVDLALKGQEIGPHDAAVNVLNAQEVHDLFAHLGVVDVVYHLAGPVAEEVRKRTAACMELQVTGTLNMLEGAVKARAGKLILASTFYVFGSYPAEAVVNEASPLDLMGLELFAASKVMSERLVRQYGLTHGLAWGIGRFGSVYGFPVGPFAKGSNAVRTFIETGFRDDPIEVWGSGTRRNQYTALRDVVDGLVDMQATAGQVYNLISPEVTTTGDLARHMESRYGFRVVFDPEKKDGVSMAYMSSRKAIEELGWMPTPLAKGIEETVEAMRQADTKA